GFLTWVTRLLCRLTLRPSPTLISLNEATYSHLRQPRDGARVGSPSSATVDRSTCCDGTSCGGSTRRDSYPSGNPFGGVGAVHSAGTGSAGADSAGSLNRCCARKPAWWSDNALILSHQQFVAATGQLTPAYECNPTVTRLMKNRLNTIATKPTTLIQAAFLSRQPAVQRAGRSAA